MQPPARPLAILLENGVVAAARRPPARARVARHRRGRGALVNRRRLQARVPKTGLCSYGLYRYGRSLQARVPATVNIVLAYIVMGYIVMGYVVMVYVVMAYVVLAYIVMAYIVMGLCSYGLCRFGLYSHGL